jgi:hypothetical protein
MMIITLIVGGIILPLLVSEFSELAPWAARKILSGGARLLPDKEQSERYREEWLAGIDDVPGKLVKLAKAASIVCCMVPAMHWQANRETPLWPVRSVINALLSDIAPSFAVKHRRRMILSYQISISTSPESVQATFTINDLLPFLDGASSVRFHKRRLLTPEGIAVGMGKRLAIIDHKRKEFIFLTNLSPGCDRLQLGMTFRDFPEDIATYVKNGNLPPHGKQWIAPIERASD